MKKLLLLGAAFAALATVNSASAADLRRPVYKAPPPPPPVVYNWTGYYAGVNVGYGSGYDPTTMSTVSGAGFPILGAGSPLYGLPQQFSLAPHGWNGGGQIGYNYQLAPTWVAGIEADIQGSGMKNGNNCILACNTPIGSSPIFPVSLFPSTFAVVSEQHDIKWFGTVRGRFGYATGPVLVYATGGLAYGDVERSGSVLGSTTVNSFAGSYDNRSTKTGWTAGAGVEGQLTSNWSVKAEYLYVDLGSTTDTFNTVFLPGSVFGTPGRVAATRTDSASYRENVFRVGLNYKFGS